MNTGATHTHCDKSIAIVLASNDEYAMPLLTTAYSVLKNLNTLYSLKIYIISDNISQENKQKIIKGLSNIGKLYDIIWISLEHNYFSELKSYSYLGRAAYLRLLSPSLINEESVIYLDCDIICNIDLSELYDYDTKGMALSAVQDSIIKNIYGGILNWDCQYLDHKLPYFNTGFLIMNLDLFRSNNLSKEIISNLLANSSVYRYADQDGINAVLCGNINSINYKWNIQVLSDIKYISNKCVIHYTGEDKPWKSINGLVRSPKYFIPFYKTLYESMYYSKLEYTRFIFRLASNKVKDVLLRKVLHPISRT